MQSGVRMYRIKRFNGQFIHLLRWIVITRRIMDDFRSVFLPTAQCSPFHFTIVPYRCYKTQCYIFSINHCHLINVYARFPPFVQLSPFLFKLHSRYICRHIFRVAIVFNASVIFHYFQALATCCDDTYRSNECMSRADSLQK